MRKNILFSIALAFMTLIPYSGAQVRTASGGFPVGTPAAAPAAPAWQAIGPSGGPIEALVANPKNPRELFAAVASNPAQVFRSSNAGSTWTRMGLTPSYINGFAVDPANTKNLYAFNLSSIFKSTDQGRTFTELALPTPELARLDGNISIDPRNPKTIFIAGSFLYKKSGGRYCLAVWRSRDAGRTWTVHPLDPVSDSTGHPRVAASPARAGLVFFTGSYRTGSRSFNRVFKSVDGGNSWTTAAASFEKEPRSVVLHPADPDSICVGAAGSVYRSSDGGKTWSKQSSPSSLYAYVLAMDGRNPKVLYAGSVTTVSGTTVYRSADGGKTWAKLPYASGLFGDCREIVANGGAVYCATEVGVFKSENGGLTWSASHAGMEAASVPAFALASTSPKTVYAAAQGFALFMSANAGGSWVRRAIFSGCGRIQKIVGHPKSADTIYLLVAGGCGYDEVYRSGDGGKTVKCLYSPHQVFHDLIVDRKNPDLLAVAGKVTQSGTRSMGVFLSSTGGASWTAVRVSPDPNSRATAIARDPARPAVLYAGGSSGSGEGLLFKSVNGGASWTDVTNGILGPIQDIEVDPVTSRIVYAATTEGFWKSLNGGESWTKSLAEPALRLIINPKNAKEIIVGTIFSGVFRSTDQGAAWVDLSAGLDIKSLLCLGLDPGARILYAGLSGGGIVKRKL